MPEVWEVFTQELSRCCQKNKLAVHAFVLMSNHFHLLASTPSANISQCMHQFMQRSSRELTRRGNRINETFAGRHYKCVMQDPNYFLNAYKYVYRNPVHAGLSFAVEDYEFSSLRAIVERRSPGFPIEEDTVFGSDPVGTLNWLNAPPDREKLDAFRCGMRRPCFTSKKLKGSNRPILGPNDLL